ncbi:hypothetical protein ACTA71_000204 [Dictyostelium dimigraforme]
MEISKLLNKSTNSLAFSTNEISFPNQNNSLRVTNQFFSEQSLNEISIKKKLCRHIGCGKLLNTKHRRRHETNATHRSRKCSPDCYGCHGHFRKGKQSNF